MLDLSIAVPQYKKTLAAELGGNTEMLNNLTQGDEHLYGIYEKELDLADVVLCGSQFVKDSCLSLGVSEKKLKVLPYGADLEKFRAAPHWLPKESGKTKIVFVGSVNHRKGADILLKMWPEIAAAFPAAELHFFGGVSIDLPQNLPQVHFHGFVAQKDLVAEMRTAQISVLPTFFEGSSLAIYQSMAMGLAVVTTPNAGSVITPGKNGLLVPYGSEAALKDALVQVLANADYRETLATAARRDIQQYTWDNYGVNLANIITDELAQGLRLKHYPEPVAGSESAGMGVKTVVAK
ncbi:glycosyltransferase family 4 protein [Pseudocnuella soli]|uniref:glycosyltransferase family 4 protein n=1 Tax=Pseudocnuella soli TaxID=2502779 RepID=UPI001404CC08|nr:glycosyltransferase family 4 protein [Pseudocnuella soli]